MAFCVPAFDAVLQESSEERAEKRLKIPAVQPGIMSRLRSTNERIVRGLQSLSLGKRSDSLSVRLKTHFDSRARQWAAESNSMNMQKAGLETLSTAIDSQREILSRMQTLAQQASSDLLTAENRSQMALELRGLIKEYDRIFRETEFDRFKGVNEIADRVLPSLEKTDLVSVLKKDRFNFETTEFVSNSSLEPAVGNGDMKDCDLDGDVDWIFLGSSTEIKWQKNNGQGVFSRSTTLFNLGFSASSFKMQDMDEDGDQDIAVWGSNRVQFLLNAGDGSFSWGASFSLEGFATPSDLELGDLNADGQIDVALTSSNSLRVFLSDGTGSYNSSMSYGVGTTPGGLSLFDMNNDGLLDVAVSNGGSNNLTLYQNRGDGVMVNRSTLAADSSLFSHDHVFGDFNGDGNQDLLVYGNYSILTPFFAIGGLGQAYFGNGQGSFSAAASFGLSLNPIIQTVEDFDSDGLDDFAFAEAFYRSTGDGSFVSNQGGLLIGEGAHFAADLNGDGVPDLSMYGGESSWSIAYGKTSLVSRQGDLDLSSSEQALRALALIDGAISRVDEALTEIGTSSQLLTQKFESREKVSEARATAASQILDLDLSQATQQLMLDQIRAQAQLAALSQSQVQMKQVLLLLNA